MTHEKLPLPTPESLPESALPSAPESAPFPVAGAAEADTSVASVAPLVGRKTPIVGIGASAGGLEALEQFFANVPHNSGLAYVVVQHLDPVKESLLPNLLQRVCRVPVVQVRDITPIQANHVYVAPPGFEITLMHGVLHLLKPVAPRGLQLPIDFFLRSLALDQQANAAGVILSGMGSDGTLGLRALKEKAGGVFVQTPENASFDAMPRNAVDSGLADVIAPADQLPEKIMAYFKHPLLAGPMDEHTVDRLHGALEKVLILVRAQTGHDFTEYKKSTVYRRIQRRMAIHQIEGVDEYVQYVRENQIEAELLFKELLIGVTCFFRDPEVWQHLKQEALPALFAANPAGGILRAWVAACSTGEEAYTVAILFAEVLEDLKPAARFSMQIFATDMDKDAIEKGRAGFYPDNIASDVSPERLARFFTKVSGGYRVSKEIRSMIIFAPQSIASDPPFARLNLLTCRNLLIYLEGELQQKLIHMFHGSLNPGGFLVLGTAETVGSATHLFAPVGSKTRIYRRLADAGRPAMLGFPMHPAAARTPAHGSTVRAASVSDTSPSLQMLADQLLLKKFAPSAVLVTAQGDIVYFSGKTGRYLEPPAGKANLNLFAMLRPSLRQPVSDIFYRTVRQKVPASLDAVALGEDGTGPAVRISVEPLDEPKALEGMLMVVFSDIVSAPVQAANGQPGQPAEAGHVARVAELMQELARSREEHQATREEMQTSQEELKSANEELQSANEELTTSREEMQSMNEELQTVNSELQTRVDALARASDDMENLLNSTDIATLFLDRLLHVRRFTTRATNIIKLIPGDIGRPISDLTTDLKADLSVDAAEVLRTLMFKEKDVEASGKRWFRVRIMPYRTQDNRIDGVVITFTDITASKQVEASLRSSAAGS
jgi:two-component system CheB/CheR fusion protein